MQWTKEQQNVIDFRNRNILVSAAAGSGKTAVFTCFADNPPIPPNINANDATAPNKPFFIFLFP